MERIRNRLIILFVIFVVLPALIYLAGRIFNILISTPPWVYCAFSGLGFMMFILMGMWGMQSNKKAEIERNIYTNIYNEVAEEFARNIFTKPIETKMLYIDLKEKFKEYRITTGVDEISEKDEIDIFKNRYATEYEIFRSEHGSLPTLYDVPSSGEDASLQVKNIKTEVLDIANKLYKKETISQKLIEDLDEKLFSIESGEVVEGIDIYKQKLEENPEEARRAIAEVRKELTHNQRLGLKLSQKLFNGKAYLHYGTIDLIDSGCRENIRKNAESMIKEKMQSNPELTRKLYYELENAMKINNADLIYDLCEKLIGNRYLPFFDIRLVMMGARKYVKGDERN